MKIKLQRYGSLGAVRFVFSKELETQAEVRVGVPNYPYPNSWIPGLPIAEFQSDSQRSCSARTLSLIMELNAPTKKRRMGEGKLAGKFALVTAAAQGIGEATARVSLCW